MNPKIVLSVSVALFLLAACGFKGGLYLPEKDKKAVFGPVQVGVGLPSTASSEPEPKK